MNNSNWGFKKDYRTPFRNYKGFSKGTMLYYNKNKFYQTRPKNISLRRKQLVKRICSIKLKSGNTKPIYRVFTKIDPPKDLKEIFIDEEYKRSWIISWKQEI
jgi:hypothetical protein